jgi:rod shape-determining protein MreC
MNLKRFFINTRHHFLLVALLVVSLFLISISDSESSDRPKTYLFGIFASINSVFSSLFVPALKVDNIDELRKRDAELMLQNSLLRKYGLEYRKLQNLLDLKSNSKLKLMAAEIVAKDVSPVKSFFVINRGESDSVRNGATVIDDNGLLGLVVSVDKDYSIVRSIENGKSKITVRIERSGVNGIMNWDGKELIITNISSNYDVKIGDRIVTSPVSLRFTAGIPVGVVTEKIKTVSGLLTNLVVKPFSDFGSARYCFVVTNGTDNLRKISLGEKVE